MKGFLLLFSLNTQKVLLAGEYHGNCFQRPNNFCRLEDLKYFCFCSCCFCCNLLSFVYLNLIHFTLTLWHQCNIHTYIHTYIHAYIHSYLWMNKQTSGHKIKFKIKKKKNLSMND